MGKSVVRVLVVDDFEQWRVAVRAMVEQMSGLQVVGEASDGEEAVQKTQEMQPDLVVLDIGLPTLNGIEVARQISRISPKSKIVFLTENHCCDVAEAALDAGASAYVIKSYAGKELIPAISAVLEKNARLSDNLTALTF